MDSENQPETPDRVPEPAAPPRAPHVPGWRTFPSPPEPDLEYQGLRWMFIGDQGLRAGWSLAVLYSVFRLIRYCIAVSNRHYHFLGRQTEFTAYVAFKGELAALVMVLLAVGAVALIEQRSLLDFNLRGPRPALNFFSGLAAGFVALSTLVWAMDWGGWLHFGPEALSGAQIFKYAALWGAAFLLVGCVEEGVFRCFLQATLTRGINFWWALASVGAMCLRLALHVEGNGVWGVYGIALAGFFPCLWLQLRKSPRSGFWQAAWVTSTAFGFVHTGNNGENWIGIFAAALIGFVFCVSIWVTGSAWWAIGCHAAWDWTETYFYGTADSGFVAKGHFLSTTTTGNPLWSGGTDGPEGSLLVIAVCLLLLLALLIIYRPQKPAQSGIASAEQLAS
ncbi:MAG TPA: CPBP family intramembrane glutamic endopeptidase [Terracidiphilus sp.]|nr:CPBP family intramembrane glutamic endopeptidase [Terracidiphilus sp.]